MKKFYRLAVVGPLTLLPTSGCFSEIPVDQAHANDLVAPAPGPVIIATEEEGAATGEPIGTAVEASSWGIGCRVACWTAAGMGAGAVGAACGGTTVITLGGTTIPCTWALIAAGGALSGGAQYCSERLCPP